jgi:predicted metal-dependent hydrolase
MEVSSIILKNLGRPLAVALRKSSKAKNVAVRIKGKDVELVLPKTSNKSSALEFLVKKESWIRNKLLNISEPCNNVDPNIKLPIKLPILGTSHDIKYINCEKEFYVKKDINTITVTSPQGMHSEVLSQYIKQCSLEEIKKLARYIAKNFDLKKYGKISVKEVTSKWGSCSSNGNLSFNWRVMFAPQSVYYYVVAHEMSHLKEMNHSDKFWRIVKKIDPNYQRSIAWLKKYGASLYQYLPKNSS